MSGLRYERMSESEPPLGLRDGEVVIAPYDDRWPSPNRGTTG